MSTESLPAEKRVTWRECSQCSRRWLGGYDHCCACIDSIIESQARRIVAMEKGIEQAKQCYMDLAREHADYKRAHEPRAWQCHCGMWNKQEFAGCCKCLKSPPSTWAGSCIHHGGWTGQPTCPQCNPSTKVGSQS